MDEELNVTPSAEEVLTPENIDELPEEDEDISSSEEEKMEIDPTEGPTEPESEEEDGDTPTNEELPELEPALA